MSQINVRIHEKHSISTIDGERLNLWEGVDEVGFS